MCNEKFLFAPEVLPHSDPHHSTAYSMYRSTHAHMGETPAFALLPHPGCFYSALYGFQLTCEKSWRIH